MFMQGVIQLITTSRATFVKQGRRLEYFTITYNSLEGLIAIVTGVLAGSVALVGFGFDSVNRTRKKNPQPCAGCHR
jgi:hypothetical protein